MAQRGARVKEVAAFDREVTFRDAITLEFPLNLVRRASAPAAPGANKVILYVIDGTTSGTLKLAAKAGATGAETVIMDDIPQS